MPTVDIKIHTKGFLSEPVIYKNVRQHTIEFIDEIAVIEFYYTPRKGKERYYVFRIPINNLISISERRIQ